MGHSASPELVNYFAKVRIEIYHGIKTEVKDLIFKVNAINYCDKIGSYPLKHKVLMSEDFDTYKQAKDYEF